MNRLFVGHRKQGSIYRFGMGTDIFMGFFCFSGFHESRTYCQHLKSGNATRKGVL